MDGYGLRYEEVCEVASHRVAEILRLITPDNRLPDPRRFMDMKSNLGQAGDLAQAVKLAEIAVVTTALKDYDSVKLDGKIADLKNWADRTGHLLDVMRRLTGAAKTQRLVMRVRDDLSTMLRVIETNQVQGRADRRANNILSFTTAGTVPRGEDQALRQTARA
jgi:hypothetical protein